MKISLVFIVVLLIGCSAAPTNEDGQLPTDLAGLKSLQTEKKKEARVLQKSLDEIEEKIHALDPNKKENKHLVTTMVIERKDFRRYATIQGVVASKNLVTVSSEMPGRLTSVTVDEGYPVKKGQLIATIDLESMKKQREEMETQLELANDIYERQSRLWEQNIGSEIQYLQAKNSVERLEKSIETIDYSLTKSNIYAPITGVVDMANLKAGEMAQPGSPIVMILDTRNIMVVADVPENYLGKVTMGQTVNISLPAIGENIEAPITLIGRKIDAANRTFKIEVDVSNKGGLLKPNLLAEVQINDYVEPDVVVISQELIQQEVGGKDFVVISETNDGASTAKKIYIKTGESYEGDVIVLDGLIGGEHIVLEGSRGLSDNQIIEIVNTEDDNNGE